MGVGSRAAVGGAVGRGERTRHRLDLDLPDLRDRQLGRRESRPFASSRTEASVRQPILRTGVIHEDFEGAALLTLGLVMAARRGTPRRFPTPRRSTRCSRREAERGTSTTAARPVRRRNGSRPTWPTWATRKPRRCPPTKRRPSTSTPTTRWRSTIALDRYPITGSIRDVDGAFQKIRERKVGRGVASGCDAIENKLRALSRRPHPLRDRLRFGSPARRSPPPRLYQADGISPT